jgi:uncharacterized protein YbaR (Trm112 family)
MSEIDSGILALLVCPEDHTPLRPADGALLSKLNAAVAAGQVRNRAGEAVVQPLQGGLIREDGALLYPVVDGIPVMLLGEAISLDQVL